MVKQNFNSKSEALRFSQLTDIEMTKQMIKSIEEQGLEDSTDFKRNMLEKFGV
jgi:hypothetical protein